MQGQKFTIEEILPRDLEELKIILGEGDLFSVFEDYGDFQLLILRGLDLQENHPSFIIESYVFKSGEIYFFLKDQYAFIRLEKGELDFLRRLDLLYSRNNQIILSFLLEIEKLESGLFDRNIPHYFMDLWFSVKKDISQIENFYHRNASVYKEFLKRMGSRLAEYADEFKDIDDTIVFHQSNLATFKGRLDGLHHYYSSIKNERMNKTLFLLTVISGIFLPLNLIVGFFGMNTPGLFFQSDEQGAYKVLVILVVVIFLCLIGIKFIRMLDHYLFRYVLGRYGFYRKVSSRLGRLSSTFGSK